MIIFNTLILFFNIGMKHFKEREINENRRTYKPTERERTTKQA